MSSMGPGWRVLGVELEVLKGIENKQSYPHHSGENLFLHKYVQQANAELKLYNNPYIIRFCIIKLYASLRMLH